MGTTRIENGSTTFDVSRGADGKVYILVERHQGVTEFVLDEKSAAKLGKAIYAAAFDGGEEA